MTFSSLKNELSAQIKMPYIERFIYGLFSRFLPKLLAEESVSQSLKKWTLSAERWLHCRSSKTFTVRAQQRQNRLTSPSNPYQQIAEYSRTSVLHQHWSTLWVSDRILLSSWSHFPSRVGVAAFHNVPPEIPFIDWSTLIFDLDLNLYWRSRENKSHCSQLHWFKERERHGKLMRSTYFCVVSRDQFWPIMHFNTFYPGWQFFNLLWLF